MKKSTKRKNPNRIAMKEFMDFFSSPNPMDHWVKLENKHHRRPWNSKGMNVLMHSSSDRERWWKQWLDYAKKNKEWPSLWNEWVAAMPSNWKTTWFQWSPREKHAWTWMQFLLSQDQEIQVQVGLDFGASSSLRSFLEQCVNGMYECKTNHELEQWMNFNEQWYGQRFRQNNQESLWQAIQRETPKQEIEWIHRWMEKQKNVLKVGAWWNRMDPKKKPEGPCGAWAALWFDRWTIINQWTPKDWERRGCSLDAYQTSVEMPLDQRNFVIAFDKKVKWLGDFWQNALRAQHLGWLEILLPKVQDWMDWKDQGIEKKPRDWMVLNATDWGDLQWMFREHQHQVIKVSNISKPLIHVEQVENRIKKKNLLWAHLEKPVWFQQEPLVWITFEQNQWLQSHPKEMQEIQKEEKEEKEGKFSLTQELHQRACHQWPLVEMLEWKGFNQSARFLREKGDKKVQKQEMQKQQCIKNLSASQKNTWTDSLWKSAHQFEDMARFNQKAKTVMGWSVIENQASLQQEYPTLLAYEILVACHVLNERDKYSYEDKKETMAWLGRQWIKDPQAILKAMNIKIQQESTIEERWKAQLSREEGVQWHQQKSWGEKILLQETILKPDVDDEIIARKKFKL